MHSPHIHVLTFNLAGENTYILSGPGENACIIDPGCSTPEEEQTLREYLERNHLTPTLCLCTHKHFDHIAGCEYVHKTWGVIPKLSDLEDQLVPSLSDQLRFFGLPSPSADDISFELLHVDDLKPITWEGITISLLHIPGHSPGHLVFHLPDYGILFTGDTLFSGGIGRTDLWHGSTSDLISSIRTRLLTLPGETVIYPGHGPSGTIAEEKVSNPFLRH